MVIILVDHILVFFFIGLTYSTYLVNFRDTLYKNCKRKSYDIWGGFRLVFFFGRKYTVYVFGVCVLTFFHLHFSKFYAKNT